MLSVVTSADMFEIRFDHCLFHTCLDTANMSDNRDSDFSKPLLLKCTNSRRAAGPSETDLA